MFILAAAILWSLAGVFIKFLDIHPLAIVFYRSLFAALVFTPFLKRYDFRCNGTILISVLSYTAAISAFVSANKLTSAANAIVLQYTAPIFVFLFSWLVLREKIAKANIFALAVAMIGIGIISLDSAGEAEMAGVALALLSGVLFAGYMINLQRTQKIAPVYLTWVNNLVCAFLVFWVVQAQLTLTVNQTLTLAVMGGVQLGAPLLSFFQGVADGVVAGGIADRVDRASAQSALGRVDRRRVTVDRDGLRWRDGPVRPRRALCLAVDRLARRSRRPQFDELKSFVYPAMRTLPG